MPKTNIKKHPNKKKSNSSSIDEEIFKELCNIQCTKKEIASVLGFSEQTIHVWCKEKYDKTFSEVFEEFSRGGKSSLRRTQFKLAEKSSAMAIWLGKQYLDQRDNPIEDDSVAIDKVANILVSVRNVARTQEKPPVKKKGE